MGRPTKYSKEIADKICERIATSSDGLHKISNHSDIDVSVSTIMLWLSDNKEFSDSYARARELQADLLADEIIELSDREKRTTSISTQMLPNDGEKGENLGNKMSNQYMTEHDNPARTRLQIDARKWKASKLAPKKYGDKLEHSGEIKTGTVVVLPLRKKEEED